MIEELLIEKKNLEEEYKEEISNLDNRIKILSKNMFTIHENFYKQNFIITNPYYKYNIELHMKYISLDIIYKCIERLNNNYIILEEHNYEIYRKEDSCLFSGIYEEKEKSNKNIILNIKYFEKKYLFLEYFISKNIINEIPIHKNNLLELLYYIRDSKVYKIVKNLHFYNFAT
jgi:hypothetical protein